MGDESDIWRLFLEANKGKPDDLSDSDEPEEEIEKGETNFSHGNEFPNVDKEYDKVVKIDFIQGVGEEKEELFAKNNIKSVIEYVDKFLPWVRKEYIGDKLDVADVDRFSLDTLRDAIDRGISTQVYWMHQTEEKVKGPGTEKWWVDSFNKAKGIEKRYPGTMDQIGKYWKFFEYVSGDAPGNPENPSNYPLYVTLYDVTRKYGGEHEGGWWYDYNEQVKSFKVTKPEDIEKTAKALYNLIPSADLGGQPVIYLETQPGTLTKKEKPNYQ